MPKYILWICLSLLTLLGCSGDGTTLGPDGTPPLAQAPPDTTTTPPPSAPTLAELSREVFTPNCAFAGCHGGANPSAGLSLVADRIAGQLIGVTSPTSGMKRVDPGNPEGSYLLKKVRGDAGIRGAQMPLGGTLSAAEIEKIRAWIAAGAPL